MRFNTRVILSYKSSLCTVFLRLTTDATHCTVGLTPQTGYSSCGQAVATNFVDSFEIVYARSQKSKNMYPTQIFFVEQGFLVMLEVLLNVCSFDVGFVARSDVLVITRFVASPKEYSNFAFRIERRLICFGTVCSQSYRNWGTYAPCMMCDKGSKMI